MKRNGSSSANFSTSRNFTLRTHGFRFARVITAVAVLASTAATFLPLTARADNQACQLACCRGHALHAAGSCMGGECAAALRRTVRKSPLVAQFQPGERLCGFSRFTLGPSAATPLKPVQQVGREAGSEAQTKLSPAALTNQCDSDCGGYLSSTFGRSRGTLAASHAHSTLIAYHFQRLAIGLVSPRGAVFSLSSPRGPPRFPAKSI
jgi:hypothetical protein